MWLEIQFFQRFSAKCYFEIFYEFCYLLPSPLSNHRLRQRECIVNFYFFIYFFFWHNARFIEINIFLSFLKENVNFNVQPSLLRVIVCGVRFIKASLTNIFFRKYQFPNIRYKENLIILLTQFHAVADRSFAAWSRLAVVRTARRRRLTRRARSMSFRAMDARTCDLTPG